MRHHPALRRAIASVLRYADAGSTPLVVFIASGSAVAEELFFRGALWSGPQPLRTTTLACTASTAAAGNPMLTLAGAITSVIFGWQRAATGGVVAPAVTHVTWSVLMLRYLPPLFRDENFHGRKGVGTDGASGRVVDSDAARAAIPAGWLSVAGGRPF